MTFKHDRDFIKGAAPASNQPCGRSFARPEILSFFVALMFGAPAWAANDGVIFPGAATDNATATGGGAIAASSSDLAAASAAGFRSIAIGTGANSSGGNSVALGAVTTASGSQSLAVGAGSTASAFDSIAVGILTNSTGTGSIAVGGQTTASANNSSALGFLATASAINSVALGNGSIANVANTVSVGTTALGGQRQIVNLAAGTVASGSTDAINGDQLFTANQRVEAAFTAGTKYYQSNSTGPGASATGTDSLAMGSSAVASGANAIATGTGAQATQAGSIAIGPGSSATAANSVAIGSGSTNTVANTVSVGAAGNERRITNVAAGISQTDAVNVGQLNGVASGLQSQISSNLSESRRGIAATAALANVATPSAPGKTTLAINGSAYEGQAGIGVAIAHRLKWTPIPVYVTAAYGNGGGTQHVGRVGAAVEW